MPDVFVSYSRRDGEFVRRLVASTRTGQGGLARHRGNRRRARCFPEAIKRAIEQSDAFLFVITPSSVHSAYCENEVEYAREMQKRIVPVLREPVPDERLHAEIRDRNWIPFTDDAEFDPSLARLVNALDADLDAGARAHPLAGQGAGVGRGGPRQELPAAWLRAEVGRGMAGGQPRGRRSRADPAAARVPAGQP